jgi:hypothetical protein
MNDAPNPDVLPKAIKSLTIAVWCLCVAVLGQLAFYVWGYVSSMRWARESMTTKTSSAQPGYSKTFRTETTPEKPFHEMPPEEMVARASVILITSYQEDAQNYKAIVAEILKQDPNVTLYYAVGDEYPMLSFAKEKGTSCGDGQVVFMVGSPASMRSSYGFTNGRIGGLGEMPLTMLREMVKRKK